GALGGTQQGPSQPPGGQGAPFSSTPGPDHGPSCSTGFTPDHGAQHQLCPRSWPRLPGWVDGVSKKLGDHWSKLLHVLVSYSEGIPSSFSLSYADFFMPALFGIIFFLGIIGNSLVICTVFKKSSPRSSVPDIFIISLSMFFLVFAIPFTLITVAYRRILLRIAKSSEALTGQRCTRTCARKVTRVAIAICLAFFICWAPYYVLQLVQLTMHHPNLPFYYAYNLAISMGYANSCLNPFIYILLGQTVRRRLVVSVRPAAAGEEASQNGGNSAQGDPSKSGQPLLHLVSVSGR
uniref:Melanin concentrating hormone receptor 1 n=1 Tax=Chelonoidis abingdonii TaxID=106734 RepID=A0A8C0IKL2_CHEAB